MSAKSFESEEDESIESEKDEDSCECKSNYTELNYFDEQYVKNQVLVNFHMLGKYIYTRSYGNEVSIAQIKYDLANKLKIPEEYLQIMHWHVFQYDTTILKYIPTECRDFMDLTIVNTSNLFPACCTMIVPDIITVHLEIDGEHKEITVEIEDRHIRKPYVGGYRNNKTGIIYHHAYSQTGPPEPKVPPREKYTRHSQTIDIKHRRIEMSYSRATQMASDQIWIPNINDKILTAKVYETSEQRKERLGVERAVRTIQRYYRRWKLKKALKKLQTEYRQKRENEEKERIEVLREYDSQKKRDIINKVFPRTRADFSMLYAMVDRWKKAHIERISKMHTTASKLAEFYLLLNKEIEMLSVIERHRHKIKEEMKTVHEIRFFDQISEPVQWRGYKGTKITMDTIETQIGRTFKDLYYEACKHLNNDDRIFFLKTLVIQLKPHNCIIGNEIITLVEREIELLKCGIDSNKLDLLRKRIRALLLKHFKTPECNRGVTKRMIWLKEKRMENDLFFCQRCEQFKSYKEFPLNHSNNKFIACTICSWYDRTMEPWIDIAPYRFILRCVRREERKRMCPSSIVFIMQDKDMYYLVERVWHAQSIINECKDLDKLRFVRWNVTEEWSPWNCILLTEEEANYHIKIKNLEEVYDEEIRKIVTSKHMFARCVFANVLLLERSIKSIEEEERKAEEETRNEDELTYVREVVPCTLSTVYCSMEQPCECADYLIGMLEETFGEN